jgi:hypothetical protein
VSSGLGKLLDHDWWGGTVTWDRVVHVRGRLEDSPLPGWAIDVLTSRGFHTFAAKVIILTELAIGVGLWSRRTRPAAVVLAIVFHLSIEVSASVQVFSLEAIAALLVWATPGPSAEPGVPRPQRAPPRLLDTHGSI